MEVPCVRVSRTRYVGPGCSEGRERRSGEVGSQRAVQQVAAPPGVISMVGLRAVGGGVFPALRSEPHWPPGSPNGATCAQTFGKARAGKDAVPGDELPGPITTCSARA